MTEELMTDQEVATLPLIERMMVALAHAGFDEGEIDQALAAIEPVLNEDLRLMDPTSTVEAPLATRPTAGRRAKVAPIVASIRAAIESEWTAYIELDAADARVLVEAVEAAEESSDD